VARFNNEEELNSIFPVNIMDSFLDYIKETNILDEFMKYYQRLTRLSSVDAIKVIESHEFMDMCEEYFCEDTFYVFFGDSAYRMFLLAEQNRLRTTDRFINVLDCLMKDLE
jgi:hypothetical protein